MYAVIEVETDGVVPYIVSFNKERTHIETLTVYSLDTSEEISLAPFSTSKTYDIKISIENTEGAELYLFVKGKDYANSAEAYASNSNILASDN